MSGPMAPMNMAKNSPANLIVQEDHLRATLAKTGGSKKYKSYDPNLYVLPKHCAFGNFPKDYALPSKKIELKD